MIVGCRHIRTAAANTVFGFLLIMVVGGVWHSGAEAFPHQPPLQSSDTLSWKVELHSQGLGAADGQTLEVLVLRRLDWADLEREPDVVRRLEVALLDSRTGRLIARAHDDDLIPRFDDLSLEETLGSVGIDRGRILVSTAVFRSIGAWVSRDHYNFRYQDGCFRLIGQDGFSMWRGDPEATALETSANLLTRRVLWIAGDRELWGRIDSEGPVCLGNMGGWALPSPPDGFLEQGTLLDDEPADSVLEALGASGTEPTFEPYTVPPVLLNSADLQRALERAYPPSLRDAGIGGVVLVQLLVGETGTVLEARVGQSAGHLGLDEAALIVARTFRFRPALNDDTPVAVWIALPLTFSTR